MGYVTCAVPCQGTVRTSHAQPPSLPHTTGEGRLLQSHIRDNPSISSMAGTGKGHFRSLLLLLSIPTGEKKTQHPHQVTASGRHQGTELSCCIHPKAEHHLPFKISLQKGKKKSWQGAWGWLCPRAAGVSCGSNASHTFKGTPTQLMVSHSPLCVF